MGTGRLEAFSDGVIAVAITLLVLSITPPDVRSAGEVWRALGNHWPQFAAYVVSFMTIGIIWINHHGMISRLRVADHSILVLNLLVLMTIVILPFTTELLALDLRAGGSAENAAAAIYSAALLLMSVAFSVMNRHVLLHRHDLLRVALPVGERRLILRRAVVGLIPYAVATVVAFVAPMVTVLICAVLAVIYALPRGGGAGMGHVASPPDPT